jgi:methionyl-tRNA formyltransferase
VFDARRHGARTVAQVKGRIGAVTAIEGQSVFVAVQGGQIELIRVRYDSGKKMPASQFGAEAGLAVGTVLGA